MTACAAICTGRLVIPLFELWSDPPIHELLGEYVLEPRILRLRLAHSRHLGSGYFFFRQPLAESSLSIFGINRFKW